MRKIFARDHLADERLRREINSGLQVVENWNSANLVGWVGVHAQVAVVGVAAAAFEFGVVVV